jgi:hypothetical protein
MSKFAWLAMGSILALAGIALIAIDNVAIGILLIVASCAFDVVFVKTLLAEQRERAAKP